MSQRDLVAELRAARIEAPAEVRARVRLIAAADTTPPATPHVHLAPRARRRRAGGGGRRSRDRAHPADPQPAAPPCPSSARQSRTAPRRPPRSGKAFSTPAAPAPLAPAPSTTRVQRYGAYLALRVPTPDGVSTGVKRALQITRSLGGYAGSVHAATAGASGSADLTLKVPRTHVQEAVARLSTLGTITAEQVDVQDLQAGLERDRPDDRAAAAPAGGAARPAAVCGERRAASQRSSRGSSACSGPRRPRSGRARYATVRLHLGTAAPEARSGTSRAAARPSGRVPVARDRRRLRARARGAAAARSRGSSGSPPRTIRRRREDALLSRS